MNGPFVTPFLGVAVYVALLALAGLDSGAHQAIRQSGWLDVLGLAVGGWVVVERLRGGALRWPAHSLDWLLLALCACVAISAAFAGVRAAWTPDTLYRTKQFGLAAIAYVATATGFGHRWHPAAVALPLAAIVAVEAVSEYDRLALDQNLAAFAVLAVPALAMTAGTLGRASLFAVVPLTLVLAAAAAATRNRGGGLALLAAALVLAAQARRRWLWLGGLGAALALGVVVLAGTGYFSRYRDIVTKGPAYDTVQDRLDLWADGVRLARSHPLLGVGPGNYGHALGRTADPHSHVVAMLAETGFPGAGLYVAFFALAVFVAVRTGQSAGSVGATARASASGLVAFLVVGAFLGLQTNTLAYMYAGIAGVMARGDAV